MDANIFLMVTFTLYKITGILAGVIFGYLGYRLFISGIWGSAGTLQATHKDIKLLLKGAAPGTFFVVLGAVVIGITLYQGYSFKYNAPVNATGTNPPPAP
jgi:hypothetical protein